MKKIVAVAAGVFITILAVHSCSKNAKSPEAIPEQETTEIKIASHLPLSKVAPGGPCQDGYHPVLVYEFDEFHFHRPKKGCASGFWFCTVGGGWGIDCVQNNIGSIAKIQAGKAKIWADVVNDQLAIHFPIGLKTNGGYTVADLATLAVDDEYEVYPGYITKKGSYSVVETANDLLVLVDLK
jgi:hypothetical protein